MPPKIGKITPELAARLKNYCDLIWHGDKAWEAGQKRTALKLWKRAREL